MYFLFFLYFFWVRTVTSTIRLTFLGNVSSDLFIWCHMTITGPTWSWGGVTQGRSPTSSRYISNSTNLLKIWNKSVGAQAFHHTCISSQKFSHISCSSIVLRVFITLLLSWADRRAELWMFASCAFAWLVMILPKMLAADSIVDWYLSWWVWFSKLIIGGLVSLQPDQKLNIANAKACNAV